MTISTAQSQGHLSNSRKIMTTSIHATLALGITFALFVVMQKLTEDNGVTTPPPPPPIFITSRYQAPDEITVVKPKVAPLPEVTKPPQTPSTEIEKLKPSISAPNWETEKPIIHTNSKPILSLGASELRPLVRSNPSYPANAARDGIEGFVVMSFNISPTGDVEDIEIVSAEPRGIFDRAARRALLNWKYQPQMNAAGKPTAVSGLQVKLEFNLSN